MANKVRRLAISGLTKNERVPSSAYNKLCVLLLTILIAWKIINYLVYKYIRYYIRELTESQFGEVRTRELRASQYII